MPGDQDKKDLLHETVSYRQEIFRTDRDAIGEIVNSSGFFSRKEIDIALELVDERLERGEKSGYFFVLALLAGRIAGYGCYGPIPGSLYSYDLYWLAVHDQLRCRGLGKRLLAQTELLIHKSGGKRIYIETSSRPQYKPTLTFYRNCGYRESAFLEDFYAPGDGKVILQKVL